MYRNAREEGTWLPMCTYTNENLPLQTLYSALHRSLAEQLSDCDVACAPRSLSPWLEMPVPRFPQGSC